MGKDKSGENVPRLTDQEVVKAFQTGEVSGKLVMERLLAKLGREEYAEQPLVRRNGSPLVDDDGEAVQAIDYLKVAKNHPGAIDMILRFVILPESFDRYDLMRNGMTKMIDGYLGLELPPSSGP